MNTDSNILTLLDMNRSRKRWRFLSIFLILIVILMALFSNDEMQPEGDYIAGIKIEGFIGDSPELVGQIRSLQANDQVKAVVVYVDSPGGSMQAALDVYHALRQLAETKPVVAKMGQMAASAGYLVAIAADHIVAGEATLTGSVGVFLPLVDATELAQKVGVKSRTIFSGEDKLATSPFDEVSKSSEKYLQTLVNDLQTVFVQYVSERRPAVKSNLDVVKTGQSFIGIKAKELGLVDALSHESTALMWLRNEKNIPQNTQIYWLEQHEESDFFSEVLDPMNYLPFTSGSKFQGALAITKLN